MIVTFYSYKGGVGRSMALANVAEILASRGYSVICCDWDLEAPGLERYFSSNAQEADQMKTWPGIMDLLLEYKRLLSEPQAPKTAEREALSSDQFENLGGLHLRKPSAYARRVPVESSVRLMTAGSRTTVTESQYTEAVQGFDWRSFYKEWAGGEYFEFFKKDLESKADFILLDARTGVTEQGGVCTHHLADLVVVFAAPNDLNLQGARWIVRTLSRNELQKFRMGRPLGVLPIAARVEVINEEGHLSDFQRRFFEDFGQLLPEKLGDRTEFLKRSQIPYIPAYSFSERVTAREDKLTRNSLLYDAYSLVANAILSHFGLQSEKHLAPREQRIFLSYPTQDHHDASELASALARLGYKVWSPETDIPPGESWISAVAKAMSESALAAFLIGPGEVPVTAITQMAIRKAAFDMQFRIATILLPGSTQSSIPEILQPYKLFDFRMEVPSLKPPFDDVFKAPQAAVPSTRRALYPDYAFTETDAPFFCGRDLALGDVIEALRSNSFVVAAGDSGCGKTSLLFAGILPALRAGRLKDCGLPPDAPVAILQPENIVDGQTFRGLVVIDQDSYSNLDSAAPPRHEKILDFIERNVSSGCKILCFFRADTEARLFDSTNSRIKRLRLATYRMQSPNAAEFSDIIKTPARIAGIKVDPALHDRLVADFAGNGMNFGLLNRTLSALCGDKSNTVIGPRDYDLAGGLAKILNQHCENTYSKMSAADQVAAKDILAHLVTLGDGAEDRPRAIPFREALTIGPTPAATEHVINELANASLVLVRTNTIELGHPEIVRAWPLLRHWVDKNRTALRIEFNLRAAAPAWADSGKKRDKLYKGAELALAKEWAKSRRGKLSVPENQFLRLSTVHELFFSAKALVRGGAFAAAFVLALTATVLDYRDYRYISDLVGLPRPAYVGAIDGSFRRGDETWRETFRNAPPRWSLVSGDGSDERSAALSITGPDTGAIKTGDSAVYDFDMTFKVQFVDQPARASWKLRLQPNSSDGYKFDLVEESDGIHLRGYLVKAARVISLENGEQRIGLPSCCNPSDWYRISIKARNFDFMYSITVEPDSGDYLDLRSYLGIEFVTKIMRDSEKQFRWGDIGIGTDSTFKLSYFRLESKVGEK